MDRTPHHPRAGGTTVLVRGVQVTLGLGLVVSLVGFVVDGSPAALGTVTGTVVVVAVCGTGSLLVDAVAGLLPAASLMVALLTYTLQLLVVLVVFMSLERSGLLGSSLHRGWLGGAAIGATLAWLVTQVLFTLRSRIPAYDLPAAAAPGSTVTDGPGSTEGGER